MAAIADNLQAVRERIDRAMKAARREPARVALLAVSKTHSSARIAEAHAAGQRAFGENYVQEALDKMQALQPVALVGLEWHLIGPLQSNKTRIAAEHFDWVQTIDREKIARRLSEQRPAALAPINVLIQANVSAEVTKSGVALADVDALAAEVAKLPRLRLRGVMAIPEPGAPVERYRAVRQVYAQLAERYGCDTLSMGMSDDLEIAIAEGATLVRIGTALFGPRDVSRRAEKTAA